MPPHSLIHFLQSSQSSRANEQIIISLILCCLIIHESSRRRRQPQMMGLAPMNLTHILRVNVETWDPRICYVNTRFYRDEILELQHRLHFPDIIRLPNRSVETGSTALAILFTRLALPSRHYDLSWIFGRERSVIGRIERYTRDWLLQQWGHLLKWSPRRMTAEHLENIAGSLRVHNDCPLDNVVGYIDGTVWQICEPEINQHLVYNGHKRAHALKFQAITTPDGITVDLSPACMGARHDTAILRATRIVEILRMCAKGFNGRQMTLYGDQGYPLSDVIMTPFRGGRDLPPHERGFNLAMSRLRIGVEHEFGRVTNLMRFTTYEDNLKFGLSHLEQVYQIAVLVKNFIVCCGRGPQNKGFIAPSLADYLRAY